MIDRDGAATGEGGCPCLCHTALGQACSATCCERSGEILRPATLIEVFAIDPDQSGHG